MIGDHYDEKWWPQIKPQPLDPVNPFPGITKTTITTDTLERWLAPSKKEFDALKKEVEEMKKLLQKALEYDKRNNEPHCEMEDKVALLKKVAELVGVSLEDIFPPTQQGQQH
jgi:hypothetical protein